MKDEYNSPYTKKEYNGEIKIRNKETGRMESVQTNRTVYTNNKLNFELHIPKGTKVDKEIIKEDTTNIERMKHGKSPLIKTVDENEVEKYERIELHHLTSSEKQSNYNGKSRDGTVVEINSSKHDKYKQLHNINEKNNSFRRKKIEKTDKNGNKYREYVKSDDAKHYEKFKDQYWRDRANEYVNQNEKGENMGILDWFNRNNNDNNNANRQHSSSEERRQGFIDSLRNNSNNNSNNNNNNNDNNDEANPDAREKGDDMDFPTYDNGDDNQRDNDNDYDMER